MLANIDRTNEGYLLNLDDWTIQIGEAIAAEMSLDISAAHWEVIHFLRAFYLEYDHIPAMRPLLKAMKAQLGADKANSIYLHTLFRDSPIRLACKIGGLPKPKKCM